MTKETKKLREVEQRIESLMNTKKELFPIWNVLDRKMMHLDAELKQLEDERLKLSQGQLMFDGSIEF